MQEAREWGQRYFSKYSCSKQLWLPLILPLQKIFAYFLNFIFNIEDTCNGLNNRHKQILHFRNREQDLPFLLKRILCYWSKDISLQELSSMGTHVRKLNRPERFYTIRNQYFILYFIFYFHPGATESQKHAEKYPKSLHSIFVQCLLSSYWFLLLIL